MFFLFLYFFWGSLNSLAQTQNDEMWWKSQGSTLRTTNEHHSVVAAGHLLWKIKWVRGMNNSEVFILKVDQWHFIQAFWSYFNGENLEGLLMTGQGWCKCLAGLLPTAHCYPAHEGSHCCASSLSLTTSVNKDLNNKQRNASLCCHNEPHSSAPHWSP